MANFKYRANQLDGLKKVGTIEAPDEASARASLKDRGLFVVELTTNVTDDTRAWYLKNISELFDIEPSAETVVDAFAIYGGFLKSGFSEVQALRLMVKTTSDPVLKSRFRKLESTVGEGQSLSDGAEATFRSLPEIILSVLKLGRDKAKTAELLTGVCKSLKAMSGRRKKVLGAMVYPLIVLIGAFALMALVIFYLIPNLLPLFEGFDTSPPAAVRFLSDVNLFVGAYRFGILSTMLVSILLAWLFRKSLYALFRSSLDRLPFGNGLKEARNASEFSLLMSSLLSSGVPLPLALSSVSSRLSERASVSVKSASLTLEKGHGSQVAFSDLRGFPAGFSDLLIAASDTNTLAEMLASQTEFLGARVDQLSDRLVSFVTPALILFVGGVVGLVVYTISSAVLDINSAAF